MTEKSEEKVVKGSPAAKEAVEEKNPAGVVVNTKSTSSLTSDLGKNLLLLLVAIILLLATIGSTFFLSGKIGESNEKIIEVDESSIARDLQLDKKILDLRLAVEDSLAAVNQRLIESEKNLNGKIWYLQSQVNQNKQQVDILNITVEELKTQPVASTEPVKKSSKKKKRGSSDFDFSELENIGEEFETMFE